jgi:hypothetical protein
MGITHPNLARSDPVLDACGDRDGWLIVAVLIGQLRLFPVALAPFVIVWGFVMLRNRAFMDWTFMMMYSKSLRSLRTNTDRLHAIEKNMQFQRTWVPGGLIAFGIISLGLVALEAL